jgi:hypothetical protein
MASNLRVDQILPSVGTNVAIGTATGTVTLAGTTSGTFSGNLTGNVVGNVSGGTLSGISTLGVTTAYINTLSGISTISADSAVSINQNLVFPSGKGIDFSATANSSGTMTSELLSDYEEGSFSPIFSTWSGTYSKQFGRYVRIGSNVSLFGEVSTNGGTGSFGSFPGVGGFPFVGNVVGSAAKGMWFCVEGATNLGGHTACGPLDGPGNGDTGAFPNWIRVNDIVGNWTNGQLNASVKVTYRFFIEYTTT